MGVSWTYEKAGVSLDLHRLLHSVALKTALRVNEEVSSRCSIRYGGLGTFSAWINYGGLDLSLHVDGVGTKSMVACKLGAYRVIGWDAVVVNVNDVVCSGFRPVALVDYIAMNHPDEGIFKEIMEGIAEASRANDMYLLGGEVAILPDLISGVDVACAILGVREFYRVLEAREGDVIVGLKSNGIHANGYSLVRKVIESTVGYDAVVEGINIRDEVLKPVANYGPIVLEALRRGLISAAAHITGGAFRKVKRVLGSNLDAVINAPKPPKIFEVVMRLGNVSIYEMYSVFNMGVGMVLTLSENDLNEFKSLTCRYGVEAVELGYVVRGTGRVVINTYYGDVLEF